jgi:signal peptidase II
VRGLQAARGASLSSDPPLPDPPDDQDDTAAPDQQDPPAPTRPLRTVLLLSVALLALVLDVVTKVLVVERLEGREPVELLGGQLLLRVSRNPGAAFSFAEGATVLFTAVAVAVVVVILRVSRQLRSTGWALSLGLLLGGAAGNLVDRVLRSPGPGRGAVVDFIDFQVWPSFNVADSAIVTGGLLAVLLSLRGVEMDGSSGRARPS